MSRAKYTEEEKIQVAIDYLNGREWERIIPEPCRSNRRGENNSKELGKEIPGTWKSWIQPRHRKQPIYKSI